MKKNVALVLSGGGARGIAHIGVIQELEEQGYNIKSISGTSMGAVIGVLYAVNKIEEYKSWICTLDKLEVFKLIDFTFSKQGLIKGDKVFKKLHDFIPDINIEDLKINYAATATDIINKKEVVFTKGNIYDALRASIAIPTIFTPVKKNNSLLVDGGVINNIPIEHVERTKDDILIVVDVNADTPKYKPAQSKKEEKIKQNEYLKKIKEFQNYFYKNKTKSINEKLGFFNILDKSIDILSSQVVKLSLEKFNPEILINISRNSCGTFDFYKAEELIKIGRDEAIKSIKIYNNKVQHVIE